MLTDALERQMNSSVLAYESLRVLHVLPVVATLQSSSAHTLLFTN
jgi:hypothetical protein